jgi:hypothetical protein
MTRNPKLSSGTLLTALVTLAFSGLWAARAQDTANATSAPKGADFTLSKQSATKTLSFPQPRDVRICNRTDHTSEPPPAADSDVPLTDQPIPLEQAGPTGLRVTADGKTTHIPAGKCLRLHAAHVRIAPSNPLSAGTILNGTVEQSRHVAEGDSSVPRQQ